MARQVERSNGLRFGVSVAYESTPLSGELLQPAYRDLSELDALIAGGRIPEAEQNVVMSRVLRHNAYEISVRDSSHKFNVLSALPRGWEALVTQIPPLLIAMLESIGTFETSPEALAKRHMIVVDPDAHKLYVPIHRVRREGTGVDETAEQLVYDVGIARGLHQGLVARNAVHRFGLQYLKDTFGGDLLLTSTSR